MMKKTIRILSLILCVLLLLTPAALCLSSALLLPDQYGATFTGAMEKKLSLLENTKGKKIVLVGGSSVAFGIESDLIEHYTGYPTVNFGLYAALGTKIMMELSLPSIGKGDIVILSPELDAQTLSLYFNAPETLRALDGDYGYVSRLDASDKIALLGAIWGFASEKYVYFRDRNAPAPTGVYTSDSFDARGDIDYPRPENIMSGYYNKNQPVNLSPDVLSPDFVEYVNDYIQKCKKKGATVYFSFCPVNEMALSDRTQVPAFEKYIKKQIKCPFLGALEDSILPAGYFYDTNFHLGDAGARVRTLRLLSEILIALGDSVFVSETEPEAPLLPSVDYYTPDEDENARYFTFEKKENGSYAVTGLSELGMSETRLTLPKCYEHYGVSSLSEGALSGSAVRELVIPGDYFRAFDGYAFLGADALRDVYLGVEDLNLVAPPNGSAADTRFTIHVRPGAADSAAYIWEAFLPALTDDFAP